ncbi:MAG: trypsin-like peptidase domain-containing protein [Paracoccaceae bacterium]
MSSLQRIGALLCVLVCASAAVAQDTKLQSLDTWGLSRGWEGVGLLDIAGRATCTGVMIRPDLVLTAAHCLFDSNTGRLTQPHLVEFRAGWRDGKSIALRMGKAAIIHSQYVTSGRPTGDKVRNDVALLQLATPIQATHANPFRSDGGVRPGQKVSVVSYGAGRNDAPSRQKACDVLDTSEGLVVMSCDVVPGSSGAPVFANRDGHQRIVSLVSALGHVNGRQVSYGMDIRQPLAEILKDFQAGRGVYPVKSLGARRITIGDNNSTGSAKFVKP